MNKNKEDSGSIKSSSGDWYFIPYDYTRQVRLYQRAVLQGDEDLMLLFEEGFTDWVCR